jgi:rhodanese-related sulfurtransferase
MQASELLRRIQSNTAPVVVDVRFSSEFDRGHVPGAINTPFFAPETEKLPQDRSTALVIYCGHGQRAWIAKQLLALRGYRNSSLLDGHAKGWKEAGLPLEMSDGTSANNHWKDKVG